MDKTSAVLSTCKTHGGTIPPGSECIPCLRLAEYCERCAYDHITPELAALWRRIKAAEAKQKKGNP